MGFSYEASNIIIFNQLHVSMNNRMFFPSKCMLKIQVYKIHGYISINKHIADLGSVLEKNIYIIMIYSLLHFIVKKHDVFLYDICLQRVYHMKS